MSGFLGLICFESNDPKISVAMKKIHKKIAIALVTGAVSVSASATPIISEVIQMKSKINWTHDFNGIQENHEQDNIQDLDLTFSDTNRRLGLDLVSILGENGSFYFMHNLTVQGSGTAVLVTDLRIAVSNSGTSAANLRFDSLITPGYISVQDAGVGTEALSLFNFEVRQYRGDPDAPGVAGVDFNIHYFALGELGSGRNQIFVQNEYLNGPFTGLTQYSSLGRTAYEWGATPLSLPLLPIQPGETHTIQYRTATIALVRGGVCETALGCEGVQVAFGDPRNDGSVGSLRASFSQPSNNQPLIGRLFDAPTYSLANIVEQSAPLPLSLPAPALPPNYDWLPPVDVARAAVPEPSTWLMLITGFGLAGLAMRRQRRQLARSA